MGKGIAAEFKKRYPEMFKDYVARCEGSIPKFLYWIAFDVFLECSNRVTAGIDTVDALHICLLSIQYKNLGMLPM